MNVLDASTPELQAENWAKFCEKYEEQSSLVIQYMQKNVVNRYTEYIVKCWTGKYLNQGNKILSRGESQHKIVKNKLGTSRGDFKNIVDKYPNLLTR